MAFPIKFSAVRGLAKEVAAAAGDRRPLVVGGALADVLRKELVRDGDAAAVRVGDPTDAAAYVHVLTGEVSAEEEEALRRARRARAAIVALTPGAASRVPYVLATDVVPLPRGAGFPVEAVMAVVARRLGERGTALAARLPRLRGAVCEQLVASSARRNAIVGAAVFVPGADLPVLTLNQLRLVLRIAAAHGERIDAERWPEVAATLGAGFGLRAVARELLNVVPVAGWVVKSGVAYAGTRALGEAAVRLYGARAGDGGGPVRDDVSSEPLRRPQDGVSPGAP